MAFTKIESGALEDGVETDSLGYIPPESGYTKSTIYTFTLESLGNGNLGHNESYPSSNTIDAFGVALQDVNIYDLMEPVASIKTLDLGSGENYLGE